MSHRFPFPFDRIFPLQVSFVTVDEEDFGCTSISLIPVSLLTAVACRRHLGGLT